MNKRDISRILTVMVMLCWLIPTVMAEVDTDKAWEWHVGPSYRTGTRITSTWRPDAVTARVAPLFTRRSDRRPLIGPPTGYANRDYEDGFVYMDLGTDDPETDTIGLTWFWGYDNASQYSGDTVSFHSAPFTDARTKGVSMDSDRMAERVNMTGVDLSAGRRLWRKNRVSAGLSVGLAAYCSRSVDHTVQRVAARETSVTRRYVDTYGAEPLPFPDAPYENTLEGPGYLIRNEPDSRRLETLASRRRNWVAESRHDIEVQVMDVRLGPSLWWVPHERIGLRLTPHLRAAYVDAEAAAHTRIAPTRRGPIEFSDQDRAREWVYGFGAEARAGVDLYRGWRLGIAAAADWWDSDVQVTAEPFDSLIELGQWTFTASVGREF